MARLAVRRIMSVLILDPSKVFSGRHLPIRYPMYIILCSNFQVNCLAWPILFWLVDRYVLIIRIMKIVPPATDPD